VTFDTNRFTFDHTKDYLGPVMLQGRVQVASDWNEWLAELTRRGQAGMLDTLGRAVYPATTPHAFEITTSGTGSTKKLLIGPGRMYVDGLLVENHGDPGTVAWDPVLAELSNTPQPPPAAGSTAGAIEYTKQLFLPPGTTLPNGDGPYLVYLDTWIRSVDYLNDPDLIDKAIGLDSTGRLQTAWQVRLLPLDGAQNPTCDSIANWAPAPSGGLLTTGTTPTPPSGPCCLTSGSAYTGLENQLYRVEIHKGGPVGAATFKVSRDNGSIVTAVMSIQTVTNSAGVNASQLTVVSLGRDQVLGFAPGNWIELTDDAHEFHLPDCAGELHQIDTIDVAARTITLAGPVLGASFANGNTDPTLHTRIRRWDQTGKVYEADGTTVWWDIDAQASAEIPVPPAGTSLILENGITVTFALSPAGGNFVAGDYWSFAARTADGTVEQLSAAPPAGIHHHYAKLAVVTFSTSTQDCRIPWPQPSGSSTSDCGCCCTVTVKKGESINAAIRKLPAEGGEVCIMPGRYFEHVFIDGRQDVVLRGCGWQTILASPSLANQPATGANDPAPNPPANGPFKAVVTVSSSQHVQLLSFAVEAAGDEIGVLIDGTGVLHAAPDPQDPNAPRDANTARGAANRGNATTTRAAIERRATQDITVEDLVITASRLPAILANRVRLLQIERNRVAMANVRSRWPSVWVCGTEIRVVRNWLGIQSAAVDQEWLPLTVGHDLTAGATSTSTTLTTVAPVPLHPGGLQIAGDSVDVFVLENEIDRAGRNGITLGSVTVVGSDGKPTGGVTGVTVDEPGPCDTTVTLTIPGQPSGGQQGGKVVASGKLLNIEISRNRIRDTGLCGIGPVGFFDLAALTEVISIDNLTIAANTITSTMLGEIADAIGKGEFGYGGICVPDVQNLVVRDNAITNFGANPGDAACGIFVLNGEMVEISRNHVLETRDWVAPRDQAAISGMRGGIVLFLVTPPAIPTSNPYADPNTLKGGLAPSAFLPNLPALRVEHNTVRVALGNALEALGYGPFSIVNNHLASGGRVKVDNRTFAETVQILNVAPSIESQTTASFSNLLNNKEGLSKGARATSSPSCGAILFTNNTCQLEARMSHQRAWASVFILGLDALIFGNNECWVDGPEGTAFADAILLAGTLQVTSNRFQEAAGPAVIVSAVEFGIMNITSLNISTFWLVPLGFNVLSPNNLQV
jgi:hypothetical protein